MHRIAILALTPFLALGQAGKSDSIPVIHFSFYAPSQKDPPVHIVGFEHDKSEIRFVLSNESDKSVVAVFISRLDIVPRGCGVQPWIKWDRGVVDLGVRGTSAGGFEVRIASHGKGIAARAGFRSNSTPPTPRYPQYPKMSVYAAKQWGAGYMQSQFGITGVFFEDGTTWPSQLSYSSAQEPFNLELAKADAGICPDVATVANALQSVKEVVFDHESPASSIKTDDEGVPPRLRFSCSLGGAKAVCRLPLETDHLTPQPQPEAAAPR